MFSYFAYGLGIHSAVPLPQFLPAETACDVSVHLENGNCVPLEASSKPQYLKITPEEAVLFLRDVGIFRVRHGHEIVVSPSPGVAEDLIQLYIVEAVMILLLHQRGLFVLHASAVEIDGGGIVFLGRSGQGKSSIAAALHARGHGIIADDVTAIDVGTVSPQVFPGFPQIKLSLEVATVLGHDFESLPAIHPLEEKRAYRDICGFPRMPLPLKGVYIYTLTEHNAPEIVPLQVQDSVVELVRHSHGIRALHQAGQAASHLLQCAALANNVPVYRLHRTHCLSSLPFLAQLVEEHHVDCTI
jgi:hypothetical protein